MSKDSLAILFALMAFFLILGYEICSRIRRMKQITINKDIYRGGRK